MMNIEKHGLDFIDAKNVFNDVNAVTYPDDRRDYGENRSIRIGKFSDDILTTICYVERYTTLRIISFRVASKKERRLYYGDKKVFS